MVNSRPLPRIPRLASSEHAPRNLAVAVLPSASVPASSSPAPRIALSLLLLGCASAPSQDAAVDLPLPTVDATTEASLELGTGQLAWEPLSATSNRLELIHGPQGGYHVFGRVRYRGLGPDVYLSFRVAPSGGGPAINDPAARVRLREGRGLIRLGAEQWETSGAQLVILEGIRGPGEVVGMSFRLEMTVQRVESQQMVSGSALITIIDET